MLQWQQPQPGDGEVLMEFRLIANLYGFPVDENDGRVLLDTTTFPGTSYADQDIIPGRIHYYGIYILNQGVWNRSGFAWCLPPFNYQSGARMFSLLPPYYQELTDTELTQVTQDDSDLQSFLNVIGWGLDTLRTQYDLLANHPNDPFYIPLGDVINLAGQLGMPFQPEVPPTLMRKAVANWTHICQERGTPGGIAEHVTALTGYPVDLRTGLNMLLENDQAVPLDPVFAAWSPGIGYIVGNIVQYQDYLYTCIATGGLGHAPTGTTSSNTWWQVVQNVTDPASTLANPATVGGLNTWEAIYPALDAGGSFTSPAGTLVGTLGVPDPQEPADWTHNAISVVNKEGTTQDIMLRSVSRITSDMTGSNTNIVPDQLQPVKDGVPVPRIHMSTNTWSSSVRYATDSIVIYDGMLFQALRASTGATPPSAGTPVNQNFTFEAGITPWTVAYTGTTLSQSSTQAFQGAESLKIVPNGTSASQGALSEFVTVIPNATYTVSAWGYLASASSNAYVGVNWFDQFGSYLSTQSSPTISAPGTTWTQFTITSQAPANAATGQMFVVITGTPPGSLVSYWDDVMLTCQQTPEWEVLSTDNRLRLMLSGYTAQSLTTGSTQTVQVEPFIEWYDEGGNIISSNGQYRVFPRVASAGTPGGPPSLTFDGFTLGQLSYLNGRETDTQDQQWSTLTGSWTISGFFGGCTYPAQAGTRSMGVVTGLATGTYLGVTFVTAPGTGQDLGIVFRAASTSSYWRAGMTGLYKVTGGAATLVGTYSTACQPGDRLVVYLNGNVITVYRNGAQVLTDTDSYNASATLHGIVCEATGV